MRAVPADMAVIEMSAAGGPEVLVPGRRSVPRAAQGEVLIRVEAAGVNGPDMMQRKGLYRRRRRLRPARARSRG